jgi:hypothetical protein
MGNYYPNGARRDSGSTKIKIPLHAAPLIIRFHLRSAAPTSSATLKARNPTALLRARHRCSILEARSASCRISWTRCLRRACVRGASVGRGILKRVRASASLSRLRCRARSASALPALSRLQLRRCLRSGNVCACYLRSSPHHTIHLRYIVLVHIACPLPWFISITVTVNMVVASKQISTGEYLNVRCGNCAPRSVARQLVRECHSSRDNDVKGVHM